MAPLPPPSPTRARPARGRPSPAPSALAREVETLRLRLAESNEVIRAIRDGEVDAFYVDGSTGPRVRPLEGAESAYRCLVEAMSEGAAILDAGGVVVYANRQLAAMLGRPIERVIGQRFSGFVESGEPVTADSRTLTVMLRRTGRGALPVKLSSSRMSLHGADGTCLVATDLSERHRIEEQLRSLSLVDELTGLLNRRGFFTIAEQQLRLARRFSGHLVLLFADLDGLKAINDLLGHAAGDEAIVDAGAILRRTFRDSDIIARLGGDEFAVLAVATGDHDAHYLLERLDANIDAHNRSGVRPYRLSLSAGAVQYDAEAGLPLLDFVQRADAAMYSEKRRRRTARDAAPGELKPVAPGPGNPGPGDPGPGDTFSGLA